MLNLLPLDGPSGCMGSCTAEKAFYYIEQGQELALVLLAVRQSCNSPQKPVLL